MAKFYAFEAFIFLLTSMRLVVADVEGDSSLFLVDYVLEAFDPAFIEQGLFQVENGFVDLGVEPKAMTVQCNDDATNPTTTVSVRLEKSYQQHHNVIGAISVSLWYKFVPNLSQQQDLLSSNSTTSHRNVKVAITLWDASYRCDTTTCVEDQPRESWIAGGGAVAVSPDGWQYFEADVTKDFALQETTTNNRKLDLDRIIDWRIHFEFVDGRPCQGSLLLRHLDFHGDELFSAALHTRSWAEATSNYVINRNIHVALLSEELTTQSITSEHELEIHYLVEQRENWGGFIQYRHTAPDRSYYNLSRIEEMSLDYQILTPATPQGRAHFRFMLHDGEGCGDNCQTDETYYSFHYILEDSSGTNQTTSMELQGDQFSNSSFWRTGWIGTERNNLLDKDNIKGFTLEISLNSQGTVGSTVTGAMVLKDIRVSSKYERSTEVKVGIVHEPLLRFVNMEESQFERLEFFNLDKCERYCLSRPDCNFAVSVQYGLDCYIARELSPKSVGLANTTYSLESSRVFWKDSHESRGEACQVCICDQGVGTIDCRGLDLILPPKATTNWTWKPLTLDLRKNPRMTIIGDKALVGFSTLESLLLPANLSYFAPDNLEVLPELKRVEFEANTTESITNVVSENGELFADKCCSRTIGSTFESSLRLDFCDMKVNVPGEDIVLLPFIQYYSSETIDVITQSASFLAEAAESVQKCASICAIRADCYYFSFDGRYGAATNICFHFKTIYTEYKNCCNPGDYEDKAQTLPGWVSGRVPRTRCIEDNARVYLDSESSKLSLEKSNGFRTSYKLKLGAKPLRGAVWVRPTILSSNTVKVSIDPSEMALYDDTPVTFVVSLVGHPERFDHQSLFISNKIDACDAAFSTISSCGSEEELQVWVDFIPKSKWRLLTTVLASISALIVFGLFAALLYIDQKRRQAIALWKISVSEISYSSDPPEVLGRGKFGDVVKASFCGTAVAIKRVMPPAEDDHLFPGKQLPHSLEESRPNTTKDVDPEAPFPLRASRNEHWTKALQPAPIDRKNQRCRFVSEMHQLSQLRHPCIVTIMGAINSVDPLLVIEYMELGSLRDVLSNETFALNGELLHPMLEDISQGLRFLHSVSPHIVHGDLKAANCLVDRRFHVKISDFGLGQRHAIGAVGSPLWMAPELLRGESTNTLQSDMFSLGVLLYEIYSRREPYQDEELFFVLEQVTDPIVKKRPPHRQVCPKAISNLVELCLDHDPNKRPTIGSIDERFKEMAPGDVEPMTKIFSAQPKKHHSSENVLYDIFPRHVADALREGRKVETEDHELVTIFFSDVVNYTNFSQFLGPRKVANLLDRLYKSFDDLSDLHGVMKVETIGDSWMGVTNLSGSQPQDHTARIARFSIGAMKAASRILIDEDNPTLGCVVIRVGFHSGPVVADVVGARNPRYCLFGDTVNTASRMESNSGPGLIHCSEASALLLQEQDPSIEIISRGTIDIKGKGPMITYFVQIQENEVVEEEEEEGAVERALPKPIRFGEVCEM